MRLKFWKRRKMTEEETPETKIEVSKEDLESFKAWQKEKENKAAEDKEKAKIKEPVKTDKGQDKEKPDENTVTLDSLKKDISDLTELVKTPKKKIDREPPKLKPKHTVRYNNGIRDLHKQDK